MAKTAVVNPRRRRRKAAPKRRRRRNYGAAAAINPRRRRRRRRNYGAAAAINPRRRRRRNENPISPYAGSGGYRQSNGLAGWLLSQLIHVTPAATVGVLGTRFAIKQAGAFKDGSPGFLHALSAFIGANLTGMVLGAIFGRPTAAYAIIGGLGHAGDLFARKTLFKDSKFLADHFSLAGAEDEDGYEELSGFQQTSALGSWTDSAGNTFVASPEGQWQMAGLGEGEIVQGPDGTLYQLSGGGGGDGSVLAGFQPTSALGMAPAYSNPNSSFGYSP